MVVQRRACRLKAYMRLDVLFDQKTTSASIANEALMSQNREKGINVCYSRKRIIVSDDSEKLVDPLVLNLARAFRWQELIDSGTYSNAIELARAVGKDTAYVARTVRLTLLAPEIIHAILHGTLKKSISMETLRKSWPENWEEQKKYFGLI